MADVKEQVRQLIILAEYVTPEVAKLMALYRDELIKNGFTREEAMVLCKEYKPTGK